MILSTFLSKITSSVVFALVGFAIIITILLFIYPATSRKDTMPKIMDKETKIFETIKKATVAIAIVDFDNKTKPYEIIGSGFCIDPDGVIVTCRHVIEAFMSKSIAVQIEEADKDPSNINKEKKVCKPGPVIRAFAIFYDTERSSTKIFTVPTVVDMVMAKTDKDIALLRILKHKYFKNGYPFLEIEDYNNIKEGQKIAICGFPLGAYLKEQLGTMTSSFTDGIISSIIPSPGVDISLLEGFQLDITATYGNSGGPAFFLASGKVFGVLAHGVQHPRGGLMPGLVKAEPIYAILDDVENIKVVTVDSMFSEEEIK
ncbi:MAG: trypsin-like peptidase domain-containing protein [Candidatus Omnitrophota bacterium]|nr:MAG: trypsin-like peptidase domain-containing protein [Candidatus Omnitrophota bacterium]